MSTYTSILTACPGYLLFKKIIFKEGVGREKERERNIDVRNIDLLPLGHTLTGD